MNPRTSTVRLQLHAGFTLDDAREQIPYYATMGISHFYLSPISCAVPGSSHGYDVIDHRQVNPELGGESALQALSEALRARNMGVLLDIVPNHMAAHPANKWWWDILACGPQSRYAQWFDIDWRPADKTMNGKVLAPFLGHDYADSLERGDLRLAHDDVNGRYLVQAGDMLFPLAQGTLADQGRDPAAVLAEHDPQSTQGKGRLHELLKRQHYRLCGWRCAAESINWRRFFEISSLIGVRVEEPEVFDAVHELPLRLYGEGVVDGLRIDHVDGLAEPLAYCSRLRRAMLHRRPQGPFGNEEPWLVVEKILARHESLDARWQVDGTTGYDFMEQGSTVLHDQAGGARLLELWRELTGWQQSAAEFVREARVMMLRHHFGAERNALARALASLIAASAAPDVLQHNKIDNVLEAFLAAFPVYRTYLEGVNAQAEARDAHASAQDIAIIEHAAVGARAHVSSDGDECRLLDLIVSALLTTPAKAEATHQQAADATKQGREQVAACYNEAVRRFQQLTPPLAAKSLEDTVFYRYGPLLSRNEVGADPALLASAVDSFHAYNKLRASRFPAALSATATHDHKRGEDARARLAVLSEYSHEWQTVCRRWSSWSASVVAPDTPSVRAERYMLWQALVGAWPLDLNVEDAHAVAAFALRIKQWQRKALREAKLNSSWFEPDPDYETVCARYLYELLGWSPKAAAHLAVLEDADPTGAFRDNHNPDAGLLGSFNDFVQSIALAGALNGLSQTVLRLTAPGVPDLYQGTEWWDFSLVDPDNRREVDYERRSGALSSTDSDADMTVLQKTWRDGRVKQAAIRRVLALRGRYPQLFARGDYIPLDVSGPRRDQVIAFMRCLGKQSIVVAVPRLCGLAIDETAGVTPKFDMTYWNDTGIMVSALSGRRMQNIFSGGTHQVSENSGLPVRDLFADFPCAVLAFP